MPPAVVWKFTTADGVTLALTGVLAALVSVIGYQAWLKSRVSPQERERRRRAELAAYGKMGDATLAEVREGLIFYTYDVRGVEYTASQDVSELVAYLPSELPVSTPVMVRYDPRNPANSIVLAERWSGLRESKVG